MAVSRFPRVLVLLVAAAAFAATGAIAQEEAERSRFVRFLEGMLSTSERQVELIGLQGAFSSNPSVERIVVSDEEGPWLEINDVDVVWTRRALFRRVLDIDSLRALEVTVLRRPAAGEPSGGEVALPVEVIVDSFTLPEVIFAPPVAGRQARLALEGSAEFTDDVLAARIEAIREDRPGTLSADLRLEPEDNVLAADIRVAEPEGGFIADLLELRGRPAIFVTLEGAGPLAEWRAALDVQANGTPVLSGGVAVLREATGYRVSANLAGNLEGVAPAHYAALLSGESRLALDALRADDGAVVVETATLHSEGVDLTASGALTPDLVPASADLRLVLGRAGRAALPLVPGEVSVTSLAAVIGLDAGDGAPWSAEIEAAGVESAFGNAGDLALTASGQASGLLVPGERATTFRLEASVSGVAPADAAFAEALGPTMRVIGSGSWAAGEPITFESLQTVLTGATASFSGTASGAELQGRFGASITNLARFADLFDRRIAGAAQLQADGSVLLVGRAFNLQLEGAATDLRLDIPALDPLLSGETRLEGGIARAQEGLVFRDFVLANEQVSAEINGSFAEPALDLSVEATLAELSTLAPRAEGRARISAQIAGTMAEPRVEVEASGTEVVLMGRRLEDASAQFSGVIAGPQTEGQAELSGVLGGAPVQGSAALSAGDNGARMLQDLVLTVGESRASGDLTILPDGLLSGQLMVASPDLSQVAPLFLVEARGMLMADVTLAAENGAQAATFSGTATDIVYEGVSLDSVDISGRADNLFAAPQIEGSFDLRNLRAGGLTILSAAGTAERQGGTTALAATATLPDGEARLTGTLQAQGGGLALALQDFGFVRPGLALSLAEPTTVLVENGTVRFEAATLNAGGGRVTLAGRAGAALDVTAELSGVPTALANAFAPDLGAQGVVSGTVVVTGTAAAPSARFDAEWQGASVTASRNAGLGELSIATQGNLAEERIVLRSRVSGAQGLALQVTGAIGTAAGAPLDLAVDGAVPLALGNEQLAARGAVLQGALQVDISVTGTASAPQFAGRVTSEGGGFIDPETGIVLSGLSLAASVSNNRLVIERLTALSGEGTITAAGSVGLEPGSGFPLQVTAQVRQARYVDGTLIAARFDADLTLTGTLAAGPVLRGAVFLDRTEITVPESLPRDSVAVDVEHVAPPPPVADTLAAADRRREVGESASRGEGIRLDLTISAPQQIFVRGRGIDAELGGDLRLTGTSSAVVADGAFDMQRGRLDIFTQRITFDRGIVTFAGDLDPILDFSGTTQSGDVIITVTVSGRASDPEITFSSIPELPQDEVLAYLIFERGIAELSPVQIARLADAIAGLGGGGGGLLNQLRATTGLDDLDIVTDEEGAPAIAAGRYVSENVYVGVQQGTSGSSRVTIDLDITDDVKARAAVSPEGSSSIGVFFEREY